MDAQNHTDDAGVAPAGRTVPQMSATPTKMDAVWDNSPDWDNSN